MAESKTETIIVRVTAADMAAVQQACSLLGINASELVRQALRKHLEGLADADSRKQEAVG